MSEKKHTEFEYWISVVLGVLFGSMLMLVFLDLTGVIQ